MKILVRVVSVLVMFLIVISCAENSAMHKDTVSNSMLQSQVMEVERKFAKTMAARDHDAFESFLSEEAVFYSGKVILRGKQAVSQQWKPYFSGATPPFSWQPQTVAVLESGTLAISTGPVFDEKGKRTATFTSIWKQESAGVWRIVIDKGNKYCGDQKQK